MPPEDEELTPEAEPDSMRGDLEAAITEVETSMEAGEYDSAGKIPPAPAPAAPEEPAGDGGEEAVVEAESEETPAGYPEDSQRYPGLTKERIDAAPEGWRPTAREGWEKLPESVRREIHRRELDIATGLQDSAGARGAQERLNGFATTYGPAMAAEGVTDPLDAAEGLFQVANLLRFGAPQEKAVQIAKLVMGYGVDLAALDGALTHAIENPGAGAAPQAPLDPALEAQLKPMREFMASMQGQMQQAGQNRDAEAAQSVTEFRDSAEFLDDVRLDMADMLDLATNRGRPMSLQEAYDAACMANPEIRGVLTQRYQQEATQQNTTRVEDKIRTASASVSGRQGPSDASTNGSGSLRGDIVAAMDALEDR